MTCLGAFGRFSLRDRCAATRALAPTKWTLDLAAVLHLAARVRQCSFRGLPDRAKVLWLRDLNVKGGEDTKTMRNRR